MNGNNYLQNCITASSVNMFKNKLDTYLIRASYTDVLSISQWLP